MSNWAAPCESRVTRLTTWVGARSSEQPRNAWRDHAAQRALVPLSARSSGTRLVGNHAYVAKVDDGGEGHPDEATQVTAAK